MAGPMPGHLIFDFQILLELIGQPDQAHHERVAKAAPVIEIGADRGRRRRTAQVSFSEVDVAEFRSRSPVWGKHVFDANTGSPPDSCFAFGECNRRSIKNWLDEAVLNISKGETGGEIYQGSVNCQTGSAPNCGQPFDVV